MAVSKFPIDPAAPIPATAKLVPGGVQPDMKTPTLVSWSLRIDREAPRPTRWGRVILWLFLIAIAAAGALYFVKERVAFSAIGAPEVSSDGIELSSKVEALKPGEYTVKWAVVCVDTHHTEGSFSFIVSGSGA